LIGYCGVLGLTGSAALFMLWITRHLERITGEEGDMAMSERRYYLYFADHKGDYIRLAYAEALMGPWQTFT